MHSLLSAILICTRSLYFADPALNEWLAQLTPEDQNSLSAMPALCEEILEICDRVLGGSDEEKNTTAQSLGASGDAESKVDEQESIELFSYSILPQPGNSSSESENSTVELKNGSVESKKPSAQ